MTYAIMVSLYYIKHINAVFYIFSFKHMIKKDIVKTLQARVSVAVIKIVCLAM